eukprot:TRINITY_DN4495_c0_g3_i7.p1 TRINITY_DN4495_c0_g3~~TRINITY_DN4495_c0_g3_i7.p1  ORF type:complete len:161 (+),score=39.35 TRINITY_DN4495_c0_g3_i7:638-1120(+)
MRRTDNLRNNGLTEDISKILRSFRVKGTHTAAFVKVTPGNIRRLKIIESYVTWGFPTRKTISDLLYKRGFARGEGFGRVTLNNNKLIEDSLGHLGFICVEDLVHHIFTSAEHLTEINRFMWPFTLVPPPGKFPNKRVPFYKGGDCGLREEKINDLVESMV